MSRFGIIRSEPLRRKLGVGFADVNQRQHPTDLIEPKGAGIYNVGLRKSGNERLSNMKSSIAFGVGVVSGAIISSALLLVSPSHDPSTREAEIASLREDFSRAQKSAQRDREALRATLQEIQARLPEAQSKASPSVATSASPSIAIPAAPMVVSNNSAIATYLGLPVPAPANLDRRYSPEEQSAVFRDLAETLGIKVEKLAVDTTEFPFVIYGRVQSTDGGSFFKKIESELRALPGYTYGGSVTGGTGDGSTYFALNMTPSSAYPQEQAETIHKRLMIRLQMMAAARGEPAP